MDYINGCDYNCKDYNYASMQEMAIVPVRSYAFIN